MKKMSLVILAVLMVVVLATSVMAASPQSFSTGTCPFFTQSNNLTDGQKEQVATWQQQKMELHKQMLNQKVQWGWITQAQADQRIDWMAKQATSGTRGHGMGRGMGMHGGNGMSGHGMGPNCFVNR